MFCRERVGEVKILLQSKRPACLHSRLLHCAGQSTFKRFILSTPLSLCLLRNMSVPSNQAGLVVSLNTEYQARVMAKPCNKTRLLQEPWSPDRKVQWNLLQPILTRYRFCTIGVMLVMQTACTPRIGVPKQTSSP